jgi:uncharacterized protein YaaN involved in tellurite resistance
VDKTRVKDVMSQMNFSDPNFITNYGTGAQRNVSSMADTMLAKVRAKDTGEVGKELSNLMLKVKGVDVEAFTAKKTGFFASLFSGAAQLLARYDKMSHTIDTICGNLRSQITNLNRNTATLEEYFKQTEAYLKEVDVHIAAGYEIMRVLRATKLVELQSKYATSKDQADAQALQDMNQALDLFDKRIYDLQLSRMVSLQTMPQIRTIQQCDKLLVTKINSAINITLPMWKGQVVMAKALNDVKDANEAVSDVEKTTAAVMESNARLYHDQVVATMEASGRGVVSIETIKKANESIISAIDETMRIQKESAQARETARLDLAKAEEELKAKMATVLDQQ